VTFVSIFTGFGNLALINLYYYLNYSYLKGYYLINLVPGSHSFYYLTFFG